MRAERIHDLYVDQAPIPMQDPSVEHLTDPLRHLVEDRSLTERASEVAACLERGDRAESESRDGGTVIAAGTDDRPQLRLVRLTATPVQIASLERLLDPHERDRADRFVLPQLRVRFVVAHAAMRCVASYFVGESPSSIRWRKGPYGKPHVDGHCLELNASHAGDWGMIAVGFQRAVGVDIEAIRASTVTPSMIETVSSSVEQRAFNALSERERVPAFFRLWVRKEAMLKVLGTGLQRPLSSVDVPLEPNTPRDAVVLRDPPEPDKRWWLWDVPAPTGFIAALAVQQRTDEAAVVPGTPRLLSIDALMTAT